MKRTGFTFVELAIVLVIIGIIMGMAIKGRTLIESAKTRSEVRKIEKLQAAIAGWFGNTSGSVSDFKNLLDNGSSTATTNHKGWQNFSDLKVSDYTAPTAEVYALLLVQNGGDNASFPIGSANNGTNLAIRSTTVSPKFICNVESMLDDRNPWRGDARSKEKVHLSDGTDFTWVAGQTVDNLTTGLASCDLWSNDTIAATAVTTDTNSRLDFLLM